MTDLRGNRHDETYTYRKVDWSTWQEGADIGSATGGSIELSAFTDLKAQGTMSFVGREAPEQDSLIRVYYSFTDDDGERAEFCLGTFVVCYATTTYTATYELGECTGLIAEGVADLASVLKVLQDRVYGMPFTVKAGENPVDKAVGLARDLGLRVEKGQDTRYLLANDHTFEPDDPYLTIINWCLNAAGYAALSVDSSGTCHADPYIPPEKRTVVETFRNDDQSIMYPEVVEENDWQSTPNVARAYYEDEKCAIWASATNVSGTRASLESRGGRELTRYESVSELEGGTAAEKLANLKAHAEKVLIDNSNEIERVTLSHPYMPIQPFDAIRIEYADRVWQGNVQDIPIDLSPATRCDTQLRRFSSPSMEVSTDGGVIWEVSDE